MILTISTKQKNANELGYLFNKHPNRPQGYNLPFGKAYVFYPVCSENECSISLMLDIDPIGLVRRKSKNAGMMPLEQYVNDRPYVCSSFMSVAISNIYGQTINGKCNLRPDLIEKTFDVEVNLSILPCRGGEDLLKRLFEPLGYIVEFDQYELDEKFKDWGMSAYFKVKLIHSIMIKELLTHLYVLIPVLDNQKHYYVDKAEIDKLLKKGKGWLESHPDKEFIVRRYLKYKTSYTYEALKRLIDLNPSDHEEIESENENREICIEQQLKLNDQRYGAILSILKAENAKTVIDLGCGDGKFLRTIIGESQFSKIAGMDVSIRSLEIAKERLKLEDLPKIKQEKIMLFQGSLLYRDKRISGYDAVTVVEVIEHLDQSRLKIFERVVFEFSGARTIIISTPNREYNVLWEGFNENKFRHNDHRFEWTRAEFQEWSQVISKKYGYSVRFVSIGPNNPEYGSPTQAAVFVRDKEDVENAA
ncbi:MAG: 3' terminal RNA ribose 2'-O-methyltransferase Hen1 [bacterium]